MKPSTSPVPLQQPDKARLLKRLSLSAFRVVRKTSDRAKSVPGILTQAHQDICEAWRESACPKP